MPVTIQIQQPISDRLGESFRVYLHWMKELFSIPDIEKIIIDLSGLTFVYPFVALPLAAKIIQLKAIGYQIEIIKGHNSGDYLSTLLFPEGLDPKILPQWNPILNHYRNRTYLPICLIPAGRLTNETLIRENLLSLFGDILINQLGITGQLNSSLSYIISEYMANIVDHAQFENGMIMVQNYPTKGYLDLCILDTGIGLLNSYINNGITEITTHENAIKEAINGKSTKDMPERGYGLSTTRKMLVSGLKGEYLLVSGNAFYVWTAKYEQILTLPLNQTWQGTIFFLRIPKTIPPDFNYVNYLE